MEASHEMVTVKVLRKEGIKGHKLQPGTTVQLPDHIVEELLDMTPTPIVVIGQRGCIGPLNATQQPLQNAVHGAGAAPPQQKRPLFGFTKLPPRGEG